MPCQRGEVHLNGESIGKSRFQQRLKKGLALVPEDRQGEGVVQMMSIQANMTLSDFSLQVPPRWRWLNPQRRDLRERDDPAAGDQGQRRHIAHLAERRQSTKVVLGKALMTQPQVVFLDEPTRHRRRRETDVYHLIGKWLSRGWR